MIEPVPYAVPTPYQPPSQGGNPYVTPGTIGTSIPANWTPTPYYLPGGAPSSGMQAWDSGAVTSTGGGTLYQQPSYQPILGATQNQSVQPPSTPATTGGTKITNLDDMVNIGGVNKTKRTAIAEGLMDEYGNMLSQGGGSNYDQAAAEAQRRAEEELNRGYNDYLSSLDQQLGFYGQSNQSQIDAANSAFTTGQQNASSQLQEGNNLLLTNKAKTLRDLSDNLMTSWRQGNTYLGTRGASDSSAANQYAYALTKMGNQARGDVQGQYDQNIFKLKNTYDTETRNLEAQKVQQMSQISQWFAEAQAGVAGLKGQAAQQRSQQALQMALQMAQEAQAQAAQRQSTLDQWAANHATSWNQLAGQLGQTSSFQTSAPFSAGIQSGYQPKTTGVGTGYGATTRDDTQQSGVFPIASMADGRTRYSDGSIR